MTTPAIDNLADICSTWAYYRYLWAFEQPNPAVSRNLLRLSSHALAIDFHQKALMSDQIGVGMAALVMADLFSAPEAADVSLAVDDDAWDFTLGNESPDYLFFDESMDRLFVVECKGTRCPRPAAVDQLRRGTEQLPSILFQNGRPNPPGFVIGTMMNSEACRVLLIDPPGEEEEDSWGGKYREKLDSHSWRITDPEQFAATSRAVAQSKILSFSGEDEAAYSKLGKLKVRRKCEFRFMSESRLLTETENIFGTFSGVAETIPVRDRVQVEIFQGLERSLRGAYIEDDIDRISYERRRINQANLETTPSGGSDVQSVATHEEKGNMQVVRSFSPDGTLLEVRITTR